MCLFCDIVSHIKEAYIIEENEKFIALLDVNPSSPGHTLIIPKKHIETFSDISEEDGALLVKSIQNVMEKMVRALNIKEFTVGINDNAHPSHIAHLHIHVIPRYLGDGGHAVQSTVHFVKGETPESIYRKIKD